MKKAATFVFALLLGASLSLAQASGGTGTTGKSDQKTADSGKKGHKGGKKGHKGGKKGKKSSSGNSTPAPK